MHLFAMTNANVVVLCKCVGVCNMCQLHINFNEPQHRNIISKCISSILNYFTLFQEHQCVCLCLCMPYVCVRSICGDISNWNSMVVHRSLDALHVFLCINYRICDVGTVTWQWAINHL